MEAITTTRLLTERAVASRYSITTRTLFRWDRDQKLGFPAPIVINGRKYRDTAALDAFDRSRMAAPAGTAGLK